VVIDDFHVGGTVIGPAETNTVLVIDADGVPASAIAA